MKALNWAAILTAVLTSVASVHFKATADGFELQLKMAQAQLDDVFFLANQCFHVE